MIAWHVGMLFLTAAEIIWIYVSCCGKFQKTQQLNITMTICAKIGCKCIVDIKIIKWRIILCFTSSDIYKSGTSMEWLFISTFDIFYST